MIGGNMPYVTARCDVPYVAAGAEQVVAVTLIAPSEPGVYQSHWRLSYCGLKFGQCVWCSVVVSPEHCRPAVDRRRALVQPPAYGKPRHC